MKLSQLFEAPIEDIHHLGNWDKNSSFDAKDRKLLTTPKALEKLKTKFSNTKQNFIIYLVNSPEARKVQEIGLVSKEELFKLMPNTAPQIELNDNAITIIFNGNYGSEKIPMTPWIVAHRIGHAFSRREQGFGWNYQMKSYGNMIGEIETTTYSILHDFYEMPIPMPSSSRGYFVERDSLLRNALKNFYQEIGTFKSARDKNLREYFEFYNELVAQYVMIGEVRFNPLPRTLKVGNRYGRRTYRGYSSDRTYYDRILETMELSITSTLDDLFNEAVGKIFIM